MWRYTRASEMPEIMLRDAEGEIPAVPAVRSRPWRSPDGANAINMHTGRSGPSSPIPMAYAQRPGEVYFESELAAAE